MPPLKAKDVPTFLSELQYLENKYGDDIDYSKIVVGVAPYTRGWKELLRKKHEKNVGFNGKSRPGWHS